MPKYQMIFYLLLCDLQPNIRQEKLDIINLNKNYKNSEGFVYILVIENKIFKIGQSTTDITKRVMSYNCGKKQYRQNGTCSTTNYYTLQSLLNLNKIIKVYAYFPEEVEYVVLCKEKYKGSEAPCKVAEGFVIEKFIKNYNKKPIGNVQK